MPPRRRSTTEEFSLLNMNEDIRDAATNLLSALDKQGVSANADVLFMGIQTLVSQAAMTSGNSPLLASDGKKGNKGYMPYSMSGDFLAASFEHFHSGKKKDAIRLVLQAFELDDADALMQGIATMNSNSKHVKQLEADEAAESGDLDSKTDDDNAELSEDDIDAIIDDADMDNSDDGSEGDGSEEGSEEGGDGDGSEEPSEEDPDLAGSPMDPDAPPKTVDASTVTAAERVARIMARKTSSSGRPEDRAKAARIVTRVQ